jgi:hypothetical protein
MSEELKNSLWSLLKVHIWDHVLPTRYSTIFSMNPRIETLCVRLWFDYYKRPLDTLGDFDKVHKLIQSDFFQSEWYEVYNFVEFVAANFPYGNVDQFTDHCNLSLERECSAYRFVNGLITRITDEQEVASIEQALEKSQGPVRTHLRVALEKLSNREKPDYRNSIKESISAIESLAAIALGEKATLGQLTKKLEEKTGLHPALGKALSNLYGYTSDEDGIRHAILESKQLSFEDAKFFLVICSAFANLVNAKLPGSK